MARDALDLLTGSLPDVAGELGVSIYTLRDWRLRRRTPSPELLRALAALLKRRARACTATARKLEREARP
jgi:transcriptional regulator with XRE-family HTH domain